jgi:hypothetical protein
MNNNALIGSKELNIKQFETRSGIYFLYNNDELVYIGQAYNLSRRILDHLNEGIKVFNRVRYNIVPVESLNDVETTLISSFKPKYNIARTVGIEKDVTTVKRGSLTFRPVALIHHMKKHGVVPVKIRFYYNRKCIYLSTNLYAYPEDIEKGNIINKDLLKKLRPVLDKCMESIKYIPRDKPFEYVKNRILSINI